jgi:hypothetical protein
MAEQVWVVSDIGGFIASPVLIDNLAMLPKGTTQSPIVGLQDESGNWTYLDGATVEGAQWIANSGLGILVGLG